LARDWPLVPPVPPPQEWQQLYTIQRELSNAFVVLEDTLTRVRKTKPTEEEMSEVKDGITSLIASTAAEETCIESLEPPSAVDLPTTMEIPIKHFDLHKMITHDLCDVKRRKWRHTVTENFWDSPANALLTCMISRLEYLRGWIQMTMSSGQ